MLERARSGNDNGLHAAVICYGARVAQTCTVLLAHTGIATAPRAGLHWSRPGCNLIVEAIVGHIGFQGLDSEGSAIKLSLHVGGDGRFLNNNELVFEHGVAVDVDIALLHVRNVGGPDRGQLAHRNLQVRGDDSGVVGCWLVAECQVSGLWVHIVDC
jgi:hypothetical protein